MSSFASITPAPVAGWTDCPAGSEHHFKVELEDGEILFLRFVAEGDQVKVLDNGNELRIKKHLRDTPDGYFRARLEVRAIEYPD